MLSTLVHTVDIGYLENKRELRKNFKQRWNSNKLTWVKAALSTGHVGGPDTKCFGKIKCYICVSFTLILVDFKKAIISFNDKKGWRAAGPFSIISGGGGVLGCVECEVKKHVARFSLA